MMSIAKVKALSVAEPARGQGLGGALLKTCVKVYQKLGLFVLYGQFDATETLHRYYHRHGFQVLDQQQGIDVGFLLTGNSATVYAGPGERLFQRWLK